jgi:2-polyprenyl-3-methyl-5-hydroxy-6-metoxy-1,4-benzoquinol methylase
MKSMPGYSKSINQQYGRSSLNDSILTAFKNEGINIEALTLDNLSWFDQLHMGGRKATRNLAELAILKPGMKILDVGCGIGGPARTLAAEFGCQVTGLDITESYVQAAEMLTEKVGLSESVTFQVGNALDLEFDPETFDVVWSQNTIMNIEDKKQLFQEIRRVLRNEGILAIEALMAGEKEETRFPVYWADNPSVSFVSTPASLTQIMEETGFEQIAWQDVTKQSIEVSYKARAAARDIPRTVGLHLLYTDVPEKAKNTLQGFEDGTYLDIYAVFKGTT